MSKWITVGVWQQNIEGDAEELWLIARQSENASGFFGKKIEFYAGGQLFTYRAEAEEICKELNKEA